MSDIMDRLADDFARARGAYLLAHEKYVTLDIENDKTVIEVMSKSEEALFRLMTTPAPKAWMVIQKAVILLDIIDSSWTDRRDLRMVGNIIADLSLLDKGPA